jgi:hypothetical protein
MTTLFSTLKTTGRAALLAVVLGATALSVAPAQAAAPGAFTLELGSKGAEMTTMMSTQGLTFSDNNYDDYEDYCLSDWELISDLEDYGFEDVEIHKHLKHHRVVVWASWDYTEYSMRVNLCTGEVYKIRERY